MRGKTNETYKSLNDQLEAHQQHTNLGNFQVSKSEASNLGGEWHAHPFSPKERAPAASPAHAQKIALVQTARYYDGVLRIEQHSINTIT